MVVGDASVVVVNSVDGRKHAPETETSDGIDEL